MTGFTEKVAYELDFMGRLGLCWNRTGKEF